MPAGRPTSYKAKYVIQAQKLARLGATDIEIADFFSVHVATLYRWRNQEQELCEALKAGKEECDARVERSLYHRAMGFEHDAVKIFLNKSGEPVYAPFREKVPPDTTACIFWLKNRKPAEWRDRQEHEHGGSVGVQLVHSIPQPERD